MKKEEEELFPDLELRSENVQEILTRPPNWMLRWGNTVIFICVMLVIIMSYIIKYPEFISAPILVTSQNPTEKVESRTNGKIEKIFIKNGGKVRPGQVLMVIQSSGNYENILQLKKIVDSTDQSKISSFPTNQVGAFKLGELQADYNNFAKALQDLIIFTKLQPYAPDDLATAQDLKESRSRIGLLRQQQKLEEEKFQLIQKNYQRSQELFKKKVIAAVELDRERIEYLQASQNIENSKISISQLEENINNLRKTKSNMGINLEKDKLNLSALSIQLFEQLRKTLMQWEQTYLIVSNTSGVASFQEFWGENQYLQAGDAILSILPNDKQAIVGRMFVSSLNTGKIKTGLKVLVKLDNYKFQEFGIVEGRVQNMSLTPNKEGNYYIDINFPSGLQTSFGKVLPFEKELRGSADIVTDDLRLIERFFYQLRKLVKYQA